MKIATIEIPLRTSTGLNAREHWAAKARRVKRERNAVALLLRSKWRGLRPALPLEVTLVRISPGTRPMDDDNLAGALKAIRDEVANQLGVDDGSRDLIRFVYGQERGEWAVRISWAAMKQTEAA